jgi:phosphate transport system substrate-binding protein
VIPRKPIVVTLFLALVLAGCSGGGSEEEAKTAKALSGKFEIFGSTTAGALVAPLADGFGKQHPGVDVNLQMSSSNWGLGALKAGMTQMGMSTRPPSADEKELVAHPIAKDGLAIVVHEDNPVEALTDDQVRAIYKGEVKDWKEVGGKEGAIAQINHAETKTSLVRFVEYLGMSAGDVRYSDLVISGDADAIRQIENTPEGITYLSIASARTAIDAGKPLKLIGFGGVEPTAENVGAGKVPIVYEVSLVTKGEPDATATAFIEFARSDEGKAIATKHHFAPL